MPRSTIPKSTIAVINQKGGVGKTTTSAAILHAARLRGLMPLGIDLDPQANLTAYLGGDGAKPGAAGLIMNQAPLSKSVQRVRGIDLVASCIDLAASDIALASKIGRDGILKRALGREGRYELAVIDTPPGLGSLLFNALVAADYAIVSTNAECFAVDKTLEVSETVEQIRECAGGDLSILGVVVTRWQGRTRVQQDFDEALKEWSTALGIPILGHVRQTVIVQEAQALGESVFEYRPQSGASRDYVKVCEAVFEALRIGRGDHGAA